MSKAVATKTLVEISLAVVVLITMFYFLWGPGRVFMNGLIQSMKERLGFDIYEKEAQLDLLKNAIKCAYYRCEKGCDDIDDEDFWKINCKSDFCDEKWQDNDGKICGFDALQYPVEVDIEKDITIVKSEFIVSGEEPILRVSNDACTHGSTAGRDPIIWVAKGLIQHEDENLCGGESCELTSGKYYVSSKELPSLTGPKFLASLLCDSGKYKTISYDRREELTFENAERNKNYRMVAEGGKGNSEIALRFDRIYEVPSGYGIPPPDELDLSISCYGDSYESRSLTTSSSRNTGSFCNNQVEVTFLEVEGGDIRLRIEFNDPKCHEIYPSDFGGCPNFCYGCKKEPEWDYTRPNMCCYSSESCDNGICEKFEPNLECGQSCLEGGAFRCPEECPCVQISDTQALCLNRGGNGNGILECGDECKPADNQCPTECPLCEEFPDRKYRCDVPNRLNIFPEIGANEFDNIRQGDKFQAYIFMFWGTLKEGEEITCTWDINGVAYGTEVFTNEDFEEISKDIYKLQFESNPIEFSNPGEYTIRITVDAEGVDETDKTDNSDWKVFTLLE